MLTVVLLPIASMLVICGILLFRKLSLMPVRFLRGELRLGRSTRGAHSRKAMRLPAVTFFKRFQMRVLIGNKGSYILLFLGILLANFILMMGLILGPSLEKYVTDIQQDAVAEYQYVLKAPTNLKNNDNVEKYAIRSMEFTAPSGQDFEVSMLGLVKDSSFLPDANLRGDTILASESFWKKFKLQEGDKVLIKDGVTNKTYEVEVDGSYPYAAGFSLLMLIDDMNALLDNDSDYFNGYFARQKLDINEDFVATIITPEVLRGGGEQMLSMFDKMIGICLFASVVVHLVLSLLLTKLVLDKNAHNIALMKIFGYRTAELRRIFINANTVVVVVSLIVTLPLVDIGVVTMYQEFMMSKMSGYLQMQSQWWMYLVIVAIGLLCYLLVTLLQIRRLDKLDMGAALKVAE